MITDTRSDSFWRRGDHGPEPPLLVMADAARALRRTCRNHECRPLSVEGWAEPAPGGVVWFHFRYVVETGVPALDLDPAEWLMRQPIVWTFRAAAADGE